MKEKKDLYRDEIQDAWERKKDILFFVHPFNCFLEAKLHPSIIHSFIRSKTNFYSQLSHFISKWAKYRGNGERGEKTASGQTNTPSERPRCDPVRVIEMKNRTERKGRRRRRTASRTRGKTREKRKRRWLPVALFVVCLRLEFEKGTVFLFILTKHEHLVQ